MTQSELSHMAGAVDDSTKYRRGYYYYYYRRQAGVSGFWCHRLERPASPRRICAVTRGFQTTTENRKVLTFLFSRSYQDTII